MLARANNRAISLAVLGKRVGATTVECCGQRIMITCGISGRLSSSTTMRSLPSILPSARALLGDDVVTAGSIPSRARFGASASRRAHPCGHPVGCHNSAITNPTVAANTVVGAVSDAAGKAVPAGVAGQALPEPYVPGSGDRVPAELRLVRAGYVGIAGGLFAVALACATAFAYLFLYVSLPNISLPNFFADIYIANDVQGMLFGLAFAAFWGGAGAGAWAGAVKGVQALKAGIRFSRLLRRPSDPRTATVIASKRGGRTLILDTTPGGYQPCPRSASRCGRRPKCSCPVRG